MPGIEDDWDNVYYTQGEWTEDQQRALDAVQSTDPFWDDPEMFEPDEDLEKLLEEEDF